MGSEGKSWLQAVGEQSVWKGRACARIGYTRVEHCARVKCKGAERVQGQSVCKSRARARVERVQG